MVEWFNQNVGFVSVILSFLTIVLSIIAIIVSIHTAKLPFKKAIMISAGSQFSALGVGVHITAINIGNRPVHISMMGLLICQKQYFSAKEIARNQITLHPSETTEHHLLYDELQMMIADDIPKSKKVYAYVRDAEGKTYKKKLCTVRDIKR